jgi:diguanylate cyclase (GGDEF)-like protein
MTKHSHATSLSSAHFFGNTYASASSAAEDEIARLQEKVRWLEEERAALWWAVGHDELTGLANRRLFNTLGPPLLRERDRRAVVLLLDLNGFKPINDQFGHAAGDAVLRIVSQRIKACCFDLSARLGGDEFAAILTDPELDDRHNWWQRHVTTLAMTIAEPIAVDGGAVSVTASIGIAPAFDNVPMDELVHRADQAMYQAKISRRSHISWDSHILGIESDPRVVEFALYPTAHESRSPAPVSAPPLPRGPGEVVPASTYKRGDPVWVLRYGAWRPGVVESASVLAIMATFRCAEGPGTVVDTMSAEYVQPRVESDLELCDIAPHPVAAA